MNPPSSHVPPRPSLVLYPNVSSILELVEFGISEHEIRRILLQNSGLHPISSLYHLVDEARIRRHREALTQSNAEDIKYRDNSHATIYEATTASKYIKEEEEDASRRRGVYHAGPRQFNPTIATPNQNLRVYVDCNSGRKRTDEFVQISIPPEVEAVSRSSPQQIEQSKSHQRQQSYMQNILNPLQQYFYGNKQPSAPSNPKKPRLTEFLVDSLFNVKAELANFHDEARIKNELERVLMLFGIGIITF